MRKLLSAASVAYPAFLFPFPVRPVFKLPPVVRRVHFVFECWTICVSSV